MARDVDALVRTLNKIDGCEAVRSKTNHFKIYWNGKLVCGMGGTLHGGKRGLANTIARLKRAGVPLQSR